MKLKDVIREDPRIDLNYVNGAMHAAIAKVDLSVASMIFVDDSSSAELRSRTVAALARKCGNGRVVVVHDTDLGGCDCLRGNLNSA